MKISLLCVLLASAAPVVNAGDSFSVNDRKLETSHSLAVLTDEYFNGQTLALKICYGPKEIVELAGQGATTDAEQAFLVLFIDKDNKILQVNLTVVFKGMTYANTIASEPADLAKYFGEYSFDGKRLKLRSKGSYRSADFGEVQIMNWSVDTDAPVQKRISKPGKG